MIGHREIAEVLDGHLVHLASGRCSCGHLLVPGRRQPLREAIRDHVARAVEALIVADRIAATAPPAGHSALPAGALISPRDLGLMMRLPDPLVDGQEWGLLVGIERVPAADGTRLVHLELLLSSHEEPMLVRVREGDLVEVTR